MKILITGNLGYIGPELSKFLKKSSLLNLEIYGYDIGLFKQCTTSSLRIGDTYYDKQFYKDVRDISKNDIEGIDAVICLAAISNDPIGNDFEKATNEINFQSTYQLAKLCSQNNVKKFIFASSCSMYGSGGTSAKKETDSTDPLTAYARSKIGLENVTG